MKTSLEELETALKKKKIKRSYQRLRILEYLVANPGHPTVDQVYTDLKKEISTLSKTTVYNTLKTLVDAGVVRVITIEDNEVRFDIEIENHGHFKCNVCGTIYNFSVNVDSLPIVDLEKFKIEDKNVYFRGICPNCLSSGKNKEE